VVGAGVSALAIGAYLASRESDEEG